jgi:hypothetical protein
MTRAVTARLAAAALALSALCTACSAGFFPAPFASEAEPAVSAGPRADFLTLGRLRWSRGSETVVLLREDGTLEDHGVLIGTVRADGTFVARGGKRTLVMQPDGLIHVKAGFDIEIDKDGTSISRVHGQPDEATTLAEVSKPRGGAPALTIEGASPAKLRTAMWILTIPDLLRVLSEEGQ